jgi:hypothetical protein
MTDWLSDALLVPLAEQLAEELGIQIPMGMAGKVAGDRSYRLIYKSRFQV